MKSVVWNIRNYTAAFASCLFLFLVSAANAQSNTQGPDKTSHAEQANAYLQSIEADPNVVPNSSAWYVQPWIWALVATFLILFIPFLMQNYLKRHAENDSESGTGFF